MGGSKIASVQCLVRTHWASLDAAPGEHHLLEHVLITGGWRACGDAPCPEVLARKTITCNARVSANEAMYSCGGPNSELSTMIEFITSIMLDPVITEASVYRERPAVRAEMTPKAGSANRSFVQEAVKRWYDCAVLADTANAQKHLDCLDDLSAEGLRSLYRRSYVRGAMTFIVAANCPRTKMETMFRAAIRKLDRLPPLGRPTTPCRLKKPVYSVVRTTDKQSRIALLFDSSLSPGSLRASRLGFLTFLVAGGLDSFLYTVLRSRLRKVYGVSTGSLVVGQKLLVWIQTSCYPKNSQATLEALVAAMAVARQGGIPEDMIGRAKKSFVLSVESGCWASAGHLAAYYGAQYSVRGGRVLSPASLVKNIRAVDSEEVTALCGDAFPEDRCTVILGEPGRAGKRHRRSIRRVLHNRRRTRRSRN